MLPDRLGQDQARAYMDILARHRAEKAGLAQDQKDGLRRRDLLNPLPASPNPALTLDQIIAYKEHAKANALRDRQLQESHTHVTGQRRHDPAEERAHRLEQTQGRQNRRRKRWVSELIVAGFAS
jgi:hypothetical protein